MFGWIAALVIALFVLVAAAVLVDLWIAFGDSPFPVQVRGWLAEWWPLAIFYLLPTTLLSWTSAAFEAFRNKFDYIHPDDMDLHTGEWIEERLKELGLEGGVSVGGVQELLFRGVDAFDPRRDIIFLGDRTFRKRDPMFWSIGAHELGHALVHRKVWVWSRLNLLARRVYQALYTYIPLWLIANSFLGWERFTQALQWALWLGVVAGVLVVIDEAVASILAVRFMAKDDRVSDEAVSDIRILLGSALATYLSPLVAFGVIAASWSWIAEQFASVVYTPIPPPEDTQATWVIGFAIVVLVVGLLRAYRFFEWVGRSREDDGTEREIAKLFPSIFNALGVALLSAASVLGLVLLTWRVEWGELYLGAVVLATPHVATFIVLLALPISLLTGIPRKLLVALIGKPPKEFMDQEVEAAAEGGQRRFRLVDPEKSHWFNGLSVRGFIFAIPLAVLALYNVLV